MQSRFVVVFGSADGRMQVVELRQICGRYTDKVTEMGHVTKDFRRRQCYDWRDFSTYVVELGCVGGRIEVDYFHVQYWIY